LLLEPGLVIDHGARVLLPSTALSETRARIVVMTLAR
jgi:hypothetical protein